MWEAIDGFASKGSGVMEYYCSDRLKVPGGWILRTMIGGYAGHVSIAQTFVADPDHKWVLEKKE